MRKYKDNVFLKQEKPQTLSGNGDIRYLLSRSITFSVRILILIVELFLLCCLHTTHSHSRCRFQFDFWLLLHMEQKATLCLSLLPFYRDVKHSRVTRKPSVKQSFCWYHKELIAAPTDLSLMSSSIILQTAGPMRPQTTTCCFCCLNAFNGPISCLHAHLCVRHVCLHNFPTFWITGCKTSKGRLKTMSNGGENSKA